jgi:archaemetzincin
MRVSSMARFVDAPLNAGNYAGCLERMIKTSSHEISHMFSFHHCIHAVCVMNGSNSLNESDSRPNRLCSECHRKLQWNVGFNAVKRIEGLHAFFKKHDLIVDAAWMDKELAVVESQP